MELLGGDNAKGFEALKLFGDVAAAGGELLMGGVVGVFGFVELFTDGGKGVGEGGELLVEFGGSRDDFLGLFTLRLAGAEESGDLQAEEEGGGVDDDDTAPEGFGDELTVVLQR